MRELKFRGIAKHPLDNKEMIIGYGIITLPSKNIYLLNKDTGAWIEVIPETVGQYTGKKDRNGVEVYEGDIVKYSGHYFQGLYDKERIEIVKWSNDGLQWSWKLAGTGYNNGPEWCEVIGNTHQNPELLGELK